MCIPNQLEELAVVLEEPGPHARVAVATDKQGQTVVFEHFLHVSAFGGKHLVGEDLCAVVRGCVVMGSMELEGLDRPVLQRRGAEDADHTVECEVRSREPVPIRELDTGHIEEALQVAVLARPPLKPGLSEREERLVDVAEQLEQRRAVLERLVPRGEKLASKWVAKHL